MTQQETEGLAPARRPKVLIVVPPPGAGCREAEAFSGALLSSRIRQGFELRLALRGTSLPDGAELPNGVGSLPFEETKGLAPARRPKVLIVAPPPGAGCREAEAFIGALLSSRIRQGFELRLALPDAGAQ